MMNLHKIGLIVVLGAGLAACSNYPGTTHAPNVVQSSGVGATGQSITGGALQAPPGVGNLRTTTSY